MLGLRCVASHHVLLDDDAASHGFDGTVEDRKKAVAGGFNQPPMVLCDAGLNEFALDPLDAIVRSLFIDLHEPAVARDVARDDRRKTARCWLLRLLSIPARFEA